MPVEVVLGLPYLSGGALTRTARKLQAPVLLSANSFSRWKDDGPAPRGYEIPRMERLARLRRGESPPFHTNRPQRMRTWLGWTLRQMTHADGISSVDLDSAGFHAMAAWNGYPWTPREYVLDLCAQFPFRRFSSMDLCVEEEVASDRDEVRERISKTVALNRECLFWSREAGIQDRLMHVIQGANAEDYLRCFDAMHGMIGDRAVIGVGSMCRRQSHGEQGIVAIVDRLDRELPKGVTLHLFGLKSDGAEAVAMLDSRVASIDSQAYGVRARRIANDRRRQDPTFSKSNEFVAEVMTAWWTGQVDRMRRGQAATLQTGLPLPPEEEPWPKTVWDALVLRTLAETNQMIEDGELAADEIVGDSHAVGGAQILMDSLPDGVSPSDPYVGIHQLPRSARSNWPFHVEEGLLHRAIRPDYPEEDAEDADPAGDDADVSIMEPA